MNPLENTDPIKLKSFLEETQGYSIFDAGYFIDEIGLPADFVNNLIESYDPGLYTDKTSIKHKIGDEPESITGVSSLALLFKLANILGLEHNAEDVDGRSQKARALTEAIFRYLESA